MTPLRKLKNFDLRLLAILALLLAAALASLLWNRQVSLLLFCLFLLSLAASLVITMLTTRRMSRVVDSVFLRIEKESARGSLMQLTLPMAVVHSDGRILWYNGLFLQHVSQDVLANSRIDELIEGFDLAACLAQGAAEASFNSRFWRVYAGVPAPGPERPGGTIYVLYFDEITELCELRRTARDREPVVAIILIDNYEDISRTPRESDRALVLAQIDTCLNDWAAPAGGVLTLTQRGRYLFVFETQWLETYIARKFSVLDDIRHIFFGNNKMPVTVSIGIGRDSGSFQANYDLAAEALDMALGRGGDQTVIRTKTNYEFFGGMSKAVEKRSKVKSRVMADSFSALVAQSDNVIVMGHKFADFDAIGAALGVARISRALDRPVTIVVNPKTCLALPMVERFRNVREYDGVFADPQEAMEQITSRTLLVVVDCHSPVYVESPDIAKNCAAVVVFDHHRRMADYIASPALTYHEPYASSTCEIVAELVQYIDVRNTILKAEAESMLAGMVLDTKNFCFNTGFRTFEAAAYLKKMGADPIEVKRLFQNDQQSFVRRMEFVANAERYRKKTVISLCREAPEHDAKVVMAQAADELLNIEGVDASFVLLPLGDQIHISARSLGAVNVQIILEKLGGGGHMTIAGAQLRCSPEAAKDSLLSAIDAYFEDFPQLEQE